MWVVLCRPLRRCFGKAIGGSGVPLHSEFHKLLAHPSSTWARIHQRTATNRPTSVCGRFGNVISSLRPWLMFLSASGAYRYLTTHRRCAAESETV